MSIATSPVQGRTLYGGGNAMNYRFHADDVGRTTDTIDATRKLAELGVLEGYSVLANSRVLSDVVLLHQELPNIPVSLHFNIVSGPAIQGVSSLTDSAGMFRLPYAEAQGFLGPLLRMLSFAYLIVFQKFKGKDIQAEMEAQIYALQKAGIKLSGIDSEQHLHAYSPLADWIASAGRAHKLGVRQMRDWHVRSWSGRVRFALFASSVWILRVLREGVFSMPPTWRAAGQPYVVASWEKIDLKTHDRAVTIECHPGTDFDEYLWEQLELTN